MVLQSKMPQLQDAAVASYNYTDLVSGLGFREFQLYTSRDDTTDSSHSGTVDVLSETLHSKGSQSTTFNFDSSPFNQTQTIKGMANISFSWFVIQGGGLPDETTDGQITVSVYHYDGTTETSLGSSQSREISAPNGTNNKVGRTSVVEIDLTEKTFKVGDQLRIKVFCEITKSGGTIERVGVLHNTTDGDVIVRVNSSDHTFSVGTDPSSGSSSGGDILQTTQFKARIPFRIYI